MGWIETAIQEGFEFVKVLLIKQKASDAIRDSLVIDELATNLTKEGDLSIDCFFLMMAHNGGKRLKPHDFKFRSIIGGHFTRWIMPNFEYENYRNVPIDFQYLQLLNKIAQDKEVSVLANNLEPGKLKTALDFEMIKFCRFYLLKDSRYAMWYGIAGTVQDKELLDSVKHKYKINVVVNKYKNIIRKY